VESHGHLPGGALAPICGSGSGASLLSEHSFLRRAHVIARTVYPAKTAWIASAGTAAITGLPQIINASMGANDVPIPMTILFGATALPAGSLLSAVLIPGTATLGIRMFPVSGGGKIAYGQLDFNNNTYINGAGVYPC